MSKWQHKDYPDVGAHGVSAPDGRAYHGSVERQVLALDPANYADVPGLPELGGAFLFTPMAVPQFVVNTPEQATFKPLLLPLRQRDLGPVRGIAIAPDSPIACCDLWVGDRTLANRFRIAPGRPFLGDLSTVDHVLVTVPRSVASPWDDDTIVETVANWQLNNYVWDAMGQNASTGFGARVDVAFPIRLELYRGDFPSSLTQVKRAPYFAAAAVSLDTAQNANMTHSRLWVVTDGRSSIEVVVSNQDAANPCGVTIAGHDPVLMKKGAASNTLLRRDCNFLLNAFVLPITTKRKFVYTEPYQMISVDVAIAGAATTVTAAVSVVAKDAA